MILIIIVLGFVNCVHVKASIEINMQDLRQRRNELLFPT